jgi:ribosome modulation factor
MLHNQAYSEGLNAGYAGTSALRNPYNEYSGKRLWFEGWTEGVRRRRIDIRDGRHPENKGRTEFQAETGERRGSAGGSHGR